MDADPDLAPPMKFIKGLRDRLTSLGRALKRDRVFEVEDAEVGADGDGFSQSRGIGPGREQCAAHSRSELSHGQRHRG